MTIGTIMRKKIRDKYKKPKINKTLTIPRIVFQWYKCCHNGDWQTDNYGQWVIYTDTYCKHVANLYKRG